MRFWLLFRSNEVKGIAVDPVGQLQRVPIRNHPRSARRASAMSPMPIAPAGSIEIRTATEIQPKADAGRIDIRVRIGIWICIGIRVRVGSWGRDHRRRTVELPLQFGRRARLMIELLLQRAHLGLLRLHLSFQLSNLLLLGFDERVHAASLSVTRIGGAFPGHLRVSGVD